MMASVCISKCVKDTRDQVRVPPVRATYRNLYKWPESDAEFVRSVTANMRRGGVEGGAPRVVDSISCRQMYLRSYTFTRNDDDDTAAKCLGKTTRRRQRRKKKKCLVMRNAIFRFFRTLLTCSASVDVVLVDPKLV